MMSILSGIVSVRNAYGLETWEQRSLKQSYAWEAYRHSGLLGEATMGILQSFVPKSDVPSIAVFNTLNWSYSGIAKAYVDHQILPKDKAFEIVDAAGNVIPAQAGESRSDGTYWNFYVKDVGFGICAVLYKGKGCATSGNTGRYGIKRDTCGESLVCHRLQYP